MDALKWAYIVFLLAGVGYVFVQSPLLVLIGAGSYLGLVWLLERLRG